jgi:hypothetical protein
MLLIPLQDTNTTAAAAATTYTNPPSSNATASKQEEHGSNKAAALPAAASRPLLLTLFAEQQRGRSSYLWTASQVVMPGNTSQNCTCIFISEISWLCCAMQVSAVSS